METQRATTLFTASAAAGGVTCPSVPVDWPGAGDLRFHIRKTLEDRRRGSSAGGFFFFSVFFFVFFFKLT